MKSFLFKRNGRLILYPSNPVLILVLQLFTMPANAQTDISFINGTWCGTLPGAVTVPPACWKGGNTSSLQGSFQAKSGNTFSGTLLNGNIGSGRGCSDDCLDNCQVRGEVQNRNVTMNVSACESAQSCTVSGTLNSTFSEIAGTAMCTEGTFQFRLTKRVSVQDVSVSSGIANNTIQTTGLQWIDYNNDKRLDLYLVGHNGNVLFKNIGKDKFVDVTKETRTSNNGRDARGASWADIDNDGDLDVFIANATGPPTLLLNNKGVFKDISGRIGSAFASGVSVTRGGIWIDINNDKEADLYVINDGAPNVLLKQRGLRFINIAVSAGVASNGPGRSAVAADFNNDNFLDIFLVNYRKANKLYLNNGNETFRDVTRSSGLGFSGGSVQAAISDYDRDRDFDLLVVNNEGPSILYRNNGNIKFSNVTPSTIKQATKGSAALFSDYDSDGDEDLILAQSDGQTLLFENLQKGKFKVIEGIDFSRADNPTGVTIGDFNNDGLPDIAVGNADDTVDHGDALYKNTGGGGNNYVILTLEGTKSNRAAIGATVVLEVGLAFLAKMVGAGSGQNQESLPLEFGLGQALFVEEIQISWPSGTIQTIREIVGTQIKANKTYKIIEQ